MFEDSTNKAASGGGARFRIPFFSRQEQKLEAQKVGDLGSNLIGSIPSPSLPLPPQGLGLGPTASRTSSHSSAHQLFLSARSEHKPSGKKLSIAAAAPEGQVSDRKPEPSDEIGSKADAACIVSPGKETLIFKSQGQKRTKQKQSEKQRFRIALFDGGRKQNKGEAKKRTNKVSPIQSEDFLSALAKSSCRAHCANLLNFGDLPQAVVKKRQEVEYEDHPNFGSTIVIRSHDI